MRNQAIFLPIKLFRPGIKFLQTFQSKYPNLFIKTENNLAFKNYVMKISAKLLDDSFPN